MSENTGAGVNDSFSEDRIHSLSHPLHPLDGADHKATRSHINILTYNIFLRPPLVKNNLSDHKDARLKEFIKLLPEFDIICLQEMFGFLNKRKHKLIRCAAKAGFLYYADSTSPSFFTGYVVDGGLLVLSRFPIISSEFQPYPYGIFSDALALKGILYTKIQIKEEVLHLYNTHTQASYIGTSQKYSVLTRGDQLATARNFMNNTLQRYKCKKEDMVLVMGDFNVDAKNPCIDTDQIQDYPGFKDYPHLGEKLQFNEYEAMTCYLSDNYNDKVEDLLYQTYGEHPVTYGESIITDDGEKKPLEVVLTTPDDTNTNQSLDFIFRVHPRSLLRRNEEESEGHARQKKGSLHIPPGSAKVEKFFIDGQTFTQLSDHYGAMVTLEYVSEDYNAEGVSVRSSHSFSHQPEQSYDRILILD